MSSEQVFTIGHSTHSLDQFIKLLKQAGITAIADVRSTPYSRINPQFNRETLESSLKQEGIAYVFLGLELGARSDDPSCYEKGRVQYDRLARTDLFREGLERVLKGALSFRIALMCAEKEPLECHRTLLVSRALASQGVSVSHILADGRIEPHAVAMKRLIGFVGLPNTDLFRSNNELIEAACALQEERIAYTKKNAQQPAAGAER
ncbi:MAG: DUF488 domain-containing protein [Nitrospirae bacterium]|nr:DUF488 domain-containing protein [Nitrospirota bacterium]